MLEHLDEVLVEQFIRAENMTKVERDICMLYVSNIKDIADSDIKAGGSSKFDIVEMSFVKKPEAIKFNGSVSNGNVIRTVTGSIIKDGRSILVRSFFNSSTDDISYSTVDIYRNGNGCVSRRSRYIETNKTFRDDVFLNINDLNNYYRSLIGKGRVL